jgi:hypothetical protein
MSNVKNSYNGIRRIRKVCIRKVNPLCVKAASKVYIAIAMTDE